MWFRITEAVRPHRVVTICHLLYLHNLTTEFVRQRHPREAREVLRKEHAFG